MTTVNASEIEGVRITRVDSAADKRGSFVKFHPLAEFQDTLNSSALSFNPFSGTIRGMHFQVEPFAEEKLVSCVQGAVYDVIADLRPGSRTFGKWAAIELTSENRLQAYLPKGIAHGFQTLLPDTIVHYFLTSQYSPEYSYSIDPFGDLKIDWPIKEPLISEKDTLGVSLEYAAQKYSESLNI